MYPSYLSRYGGVKIPTFQKDAPLNGCSVRCSRCQLKLFGVPKPVRTIAGVCAMAARSVRTSALARNQVITSSGLSAACVFDGSRLAARLDRVQARSSVRGAADQVRRYQAAAAAAFYSAAKFALKILAAWSALRRTDDGGAPGDGLQHTGRISLPRLPGALPLTGGAGRLATARACSVTRADFWPPVFCRSCR